MLSLLLALTFQCSDGSPPPCRSASAAQRPGAVLAGSIAVFPFTNRSPDSTDSYLADALPEQIVGRLARVNDLKVKSATAVSAQWRRTPDPMAAARALRVEWFVTGSIRRSGRQLAVTAELVRASSGDGAWSAPFRRPDGDIAAVEEQIAESVAVAIVGRLAPAQASALRRVATRNSEAYRLYLFGRALYNRRTTDDIAAAATAFTQAVRLDPAFAPAWAGLGSTRALQMQWGSPESFSFDSLAVLSTLATDRALGLDSNVAAGWVARGLLAAVQNRLGDSHAAHERALGLDSLTAEFFHGAAYIYSVDLLDLPAQGEPMYRRALALDPDLRNSWRHLALLRRDQGRLDDAEALLDTALLRGPWAPGYVERSMVRFLRGNAAGAMADIDEADRLGLRGRFTGTLTGGPTAADVRALFRVPLGDSAGARAIVAAGAAPYDSGLVAVANMVLGRHGDALDALERLRNRRFPSEPDCGSGPCSVNLRAWRALHDPIFAPLRGNPRFQRMLDDTRPRVPWLAR
jgi:adenylate cyclase